MQQHKADFREWVVEQLHICALGWDVQWGGVQQFRASLERAIAIHPACDGQKLITGAD